MKFLERIKQIFFGKKVKALSAGFDAEAVLASIKKETDPDEAINILRNYASRLSSSEICTSIISLPQAKRVEAIKITKNYITPFDLCDITLRKLDYNGKIKILEDFQNYLDLDVIIEIFNNLPPDQRSNALSKCVDRFDAFSLSEIISTSIPLYERLECLNKYHDILKGFFTSLIISKLDTERKIEALKRYAKEINKTDLNTIICSSETDKIPELLDLSYMYMTSKQISDIIQYYIPENKKLESLYKCCSKLNSSTISDLIKYVIPEEQKGEALIALQNRIKSNNIGEILQFCIKGKQVLDKVRHNLDADDIDFFTNYFK